jgi:hypothetical protein
MGGAFLYFLHEKAADGHLCLYLTDFRLSASHVDQIDQNYR